jgi:hypothetical protein
VRKSLSLGELGDEVRKAFAVGLEGRGELNAYSLGAAESNHSVDFDGTGSADLDVDCAVHWQHFGLEE